MDAIDRQLLDIIQTDFPIVSRPYAALGERLDISETEALQRVRALTAQGVIRRIGANFQSRKLGWHSTLCAASVPQDKLDAFVAEVNRHPGVTHNYLRAHTYNVWFTLIGPSVDDVAATLAQITDATGIPILNLPALKMYKIQVDFKMGDDA
jgi:DNA-binding Lrp family transcriptional regulator